MKQALVNGRWNLWLPDNIADWDGITGDAAARRGWEYCRFESMQKHLHYGDTFYDVGAEHGWISAVIAREFVGAENMVLFEPSPEFWVNIRRTWKWNNLNNPAACWAGFVGEETSVAKLPNAGDWPPEADASKPEEPAMAYRSLTHPANIPTVRIDDFVAASKLWPNAINIDVEGAELLVLRGAENELREVSEQTIRNVWVSVHPDLMANFGHTPEMLYEYMADCGWKGEHLGTDHEEHWHFTRR